MAKVIRKIDLKQPQGEAVRQLLRREWLVTNGLGGYASGTLSGSVTWRYHGLLIAALPAPLGRIMTLSHLSEKVRLPGGEEMLLGGDELGQDDLSLYGADYLVDFRLEFGLPVWQYEIEGATIENCFKSE